MGDKKLIIGIDGPAGTGKSTTSKMLAKKLNYTYIDSGAMYRAVALEAHMSGISLHDEQKVSELSKKINIRFIHKKGDQNILVDGTDVTRKIREEHIGLGASVVSRYKEVRKTMTALQRDMGKNGGIVMEGRDIGTVVFPNADKKFFLFASPEERARRRQAEMQERNLESDFNSILRDLNDRDRRDETRDISPLAPSQGAIKIDTTNLSFDEVINLMVKLIV